MKTVYTILLIAALMLLAIGVSAKNYGSYFDVYHQVAGTSRNAFVDSLVGTNMAPVFNFTGLDNTYSGTISGWMYIQWIEFDSVAGGASAVRPDTAKDTIYAVAYTAGNGRIGEKAVESLTFALPNETNKTSAVQTFNIPTDSVLLNQVYWRITSAQYGAGADDSLMTRFRIHCGMIAR